MQYRVPQFIEEESKLVGPLTLKQAIIMGLAFAICFILYFSMGTTNMFLFLVLAVIVMGIAASFTFLKIDGRPFMEMLGHMGNFAIAPKMYLWKQKENPVYLKTELILPMEVVGDPFAKFQRKKGRLNDLNSKIELM